MRPTLRQMQYLVSIAETGRFVESAKRLNVSQPSLSAQVADVEADLGVTLLERGRGGATLTPLGREFVDRARRILMNVQDLKDSMERGKDALAGRIRLGVLPSIGPYLLPRVVKQLHAEYPDLRLSVREANTVDLERLLKDGALDVIISTHDDHPRTVSAELFTEQLWVCGPQDDPIAGAGPIHPDELKGRSLLTVGFGHRLSLIVQALADKFGAFVSSEFQGTSLDATRQMAAMGAGLAMLPSIYCLSEARRDPGLILRPIDDPTAWRTLSLIWRGGSPLGPQFDLVASVLRDVSREILGAAAEKPKIGA